MNLQAHNRVFRIITYMGKQVDLNKSPELAEKLPSKDAITLEYFRILRQAEKTNKYYKLIVSERGIYTEESNHYFL
jgi:hypothetical protein